MTADKSDLQTTNLISTIWAIGGSADMTPDAITSFIQGHAWKFAKTMPQNPHWYVVKEKCRSAAEFEAMVIHIRKHGRKEKFKGHYYTVFDWQMPKELGLPLPWSEPAKMWSMGYPVDQTIIINAKPLSYDTKS